MKTFVQIYKWQLATFVLLGYAAWPYVAEAVQWFIQPNTRQAIVNAFVAFGSSGVLLAVAWTVYRDYKAPRGARKSA